jgi:hypothetical protein
MTKDDDFKRVVRRRARQRGERYTEARARLQQSTSPDDRDNQDRWVILRTFPGTEEWVVRWFLPGQAFGAAEVLVPRYKEHKFAPGVLLVRMGPETDLAALSSQSWVTGFVGAGTPDVLAWDAVRQVLRTQAYMAPLTRPRRSVDPGTARLDRWGLEPLLEELETNRVPLRPGTSVMDPIQQLDERVEDLAAFDTLAAATRAEKVLSSTEVLGYDRQLLVAQLELGIKARRHLLEVYRYLAEAIVARHREGDRPAAELMEAAMVGLNEAISTFLRPPYTVMSNSRMRIASFLVIATRAIRQALAALTPDRGA